LKFINETYAFVSSTLHLEIINEKSLIYTWSGSDQELKPILVLAHSDVRPVESYDLIDWLHPPFDGMIQDDYVWGRGSLDGKSTLIAIFEAMESLLKVKFNPKRTLILAIGHDRHQGGWQGAKEIADYLIKDRHLTGNIEMILDEGGTISREEGPTGSWLRTFANIGTAEKGFIGMSIEVSAPTSSADIPIPTTSIGVLVKLLAKLEEKIPSPHLTDENPTLDTLQCKSEHGNVPAWLRQALGFTWLRGVIVRNYASDPLMLAKMSTTQSIISLNSEKKGNNLPHLAKVYRFSTSSFSFLFISCFLLVVFINLAFYEISFDSLFILANFISWGFNWNFFKISFRHQCIMVYPLTQLLMMWSNIYMIYPNPLHQNTITLLV